MSDFLTNLVMRSFSGAPSVQPMTHSTYAAPEALSEPAVESFEQHLNKPTAPAIHTASNRTVAEPSQSVTSVDPVVPQIQTETYVPDTFESAQSVFPSIVEQAPATPDNTIAKPEIKTETKTEIQPAKLIFQTPIEPVARRIKTKPTNTSSSPDQHIERETVSEPKHELEIVEHVIEHSSVAAPVERQIERQITRQITRPVTRQITRPVTRQVTIENTTEKTIEHTIENTQQQEQVTSSFTTLIPNTPPRLLPALKSRPHKPVPDLHDAAEQPASQPETVINVAIGRIEVRATPASTPKRERQQNGPKIMTLDDYLQKRSRGAQ